MNKIFVIGNWKMNPINLAEAENIFVSVDRGVKNIENVEVVVCPPFPYLNRGKAENIQLGSQNCYFEDKGAFTGEVSPIMLKDLGCRYVIIGHSERRKYFSETDEIINRKLKIALEHGLRPILCINEIFQIEKDMEGIPEEDIEKIIVGYEPIWAIGTGKACGLDDAKKFNLSIKEVLGKEHPTVYGGSVNSQNARGYIEESGFHGLLVGGASLRPDEFIKIVKEVSK